MRSPYFTLKQGYMPIRRTMHFLVIPIEELLSRAVNANDAGGPHTEASCLRNIVYPGSVERFVYAYSSFSGIQGRVCGHIKKRVSSVKTNSRNQESKTAAQAVGPSRAAPETPATEGSEFRRPPSLSPPARQRCISGESLPLEVP